MILIILWWSYNNVILFPTIITLRLNFLLHLLLRNIADICYWTQSCYLLVKILKNSVTQYNEIVIANKISLIPIKLLNYIFYLHVPLSLNKLFATHIPKHACFSNYERYISIYLYKREKNVINSGTKWKEQIRTIKIDNSNINISFYDSEKLNNKMSRSILNNTLQYLDY